MANQLTVNVSAVYADDDDAEYSMVVEDLQRTISAKRPIKYKQSIGTSEEQLTLGESATLGYFMVRNLDSTNFVNVKTGTGGVIFCKLLPGDVALVPLGSGAQAPYAIADTAACNVEVLLIPR